MHVRLATLYQHQPIAIASYNYISAFVLPMPATAKDGTATFYWKGHGF